MELTGTRVLISAERGVANEFESYEIDIPPEKIHHVLYYSNLFIGESATMATESALLGTPAIFVSSTKRGYTEEIENRYGLIFKFSDNQRQERGLKKAQSVLEEKKNRSMGDSTKENTQ